VKIFCKNNPESRYWPSPRSFNSVLVRRFTQPRHPRPYEATGAKGIALRPTTRTPRHCRLTLSRRMNAATAPTPQKRPWRRRAIVQKALKFCRHSCNRTSLNETDFLTGQKTIRRGSPRGRGLVAFRRHKLPKPFQLRAEPSAGHCSRSVNFYRWASSPRKDLSFRDGRSGAFHKCAASPAPAGHVKPGATSPELPPTAERAPNNPPCPRPLITNGTTWSRGR